VGIRASAAGDGADWLKGCLRASQPPQPGKLATISLPISTKLPTKTGANNDVGSCQFQISD
jgi:hypothetical protein